MAGGILHFPGIDAFHVFEKTGIVFVVGTADDQDALVVCGGDELWKAKVDFWGKLSDFGENMRSHSEEDFDLVGAGDLEDKLLVGLILILSQVVEVVEGGELLERNFEVVVLEDELF